MVLSKSETQDSEYYGSSKTMLLWIMQAYYDFQQQKIEDRTKFFVCLLPISGVKWNCLCILMGPESTRLETIKGFCAYLHFQGTFYIKHVGHHTILIGKLCIMQRNFCIYRYSLLFPFGSKFFKSVNLKNLKDISPAIC